LGWWSPKEKRELWGTYFTLCKTPGTSEWIEMPFGGETGVDPKNIVLDCGGVPQVRGNLGGLRWEFARLHVLLPLFGYLTR